MSKPHHTEKGNFSNFKNDALPTEQQDAIQGGFYWGSSENLQRTNSNPSSQNTSTSPTTLQQPSLSQPAEMEEFMRCIIVTSFGGSW